MSRKFRMSADTRKAGPINVDMLGVRKTFLE